MYRRPAPMAPYVVWTHRAERRLHFALSAGRRRRGGPSAPPTSTLPSPPPFRRRSCRRPRSLSRLPRPSRSTRPSRGRPRGRRPPDVHRQARRRETLRSECGAWTACRPPAFWSDHVFMKQETRCQPKRPTPRRPRLPGRRDAHRRRTADVAGRSLSVGRPLRRPRTGVGRGVLRELFDSLCRNLYRGASAGTRPQGSN